MPKKLPPHRCHAKGCRLSIPPTLLMCCKHWGMVPKSLQDAIYAEFRAGQEKDKKPSAKYLKLARQAIAIVENRSKLINS